MIDLGESPDAIIEILQSLDGCEGHESDCTAFTLGTMERSLIAKKM
jgi:hypothetical protein